MFSTRLAIRARCVLVLFVLTRCSIASPWPDHTERPLAFISNHGQAGHGVYFHVEGAGHTVSFLDDRILFRRVYSHSGAHANSEMSLRFEGANPAPRVEAGDALPGKMNLYFGRDASAWHTGLPTYEGIWYRDLYHGIDASFSGTEGRLKSEFVIAPHADPSLIRQRYDGGSIYLRDDGALVLQTPYGEMVDNAPFAYQEVNGTRVAVDVAFRMSGDGAVGYVLGRYDPNHALIIDPEITYASYLGGSGDDSALMIAGYDDGSVLIGGGSSSMDFPYGSPGDAQNFGYLMRLVVDSNEVLWTTMLAGNGDDLVRNAYIASDGTGYVVGSTTSTDFPVVDALQDSSGGDMDAFVAVVNGDGMLVNSTYYGGDGIDFAMGVDLAANGNIVLAGNTRSTDFPLMNEVQDALESSQKGFVAALAPLLAGNPHALLYSTYFGGTGVDTVTDLAVASDGTATITGTTGSADFETSADALQPENAGSNDAFIVSLNADGTLKYSSYHGGNGFDVGDAVIVHEPKGIFAMGSTSSSDLPRVNPWPDESGGWVLGLDLSIDTGPKIDLSTYYGGPEVTDVLDADISEENQIAMAGRTQQGTTFYTMFDVDAEEVAEPTPFSSNPSEVTEVRFVPPLRSDHGPRLCLVGNTSEAIDTAGSPLQDTAGGMQDGFLACTDEEDRNVPAPVLTVTKTLEDSTVAHNAIARYIIVVSNEAEDFDAIARNVALTDFFDRTELEIHELPDECEDEGTNIVCDVGNIHGGFSRTVAITFYARVTGKITNDVTATADNHPDVRGTAELEVFEPNTTLALSIEVVGEDTTFVGYPLLALYEVRNLGPEDAIDVKLSSVVPPGRSIRISKVEGVDCEDVSNFGLHCDLGDIPAGGDIVVLVTHRTLLASENTLSGFADANNAIIVSSRADYVLLEKPGKNTVFRAAPRSAKRAAEPVDVYLDTLRIADDLAPGTSTGFFDVDITNILPTIFLTAATAPDASAPIDSFTVDLLRITESDTTVSTNTAFVLTEQEGSFGLTALYHAQSEAADAAMVDVAVAHAIEGADPVDVGIRNRGVTLASDLGYGNLSGYMALSPDVYDIDVLQNGALVDVFELDLSVKEGEAVVMTINAAGRGLSIDAFDASGDVSQPPVVTDIASEHALPAAFTLHENYPNPFNPETTLRFDLPEASPVRLMIYDVTGRLVDTLVDRRVEAGQYAVRWTATGVSSGIYFFHLEAGGRYRATRAMLLVK